MLSYALLGFAGVITAGLLGLLGVLRASRPQTHLADVTGLQALADEYRVANIDLRRQIAERDKTIERLRAELAGGRHA